MKLRNIFIVISIVFIVFFSVQTVFVLKNNSSMKNINIALRSNIDAVLIEANIRGLSAHLQADLNENNTPLIHNQELYTFYNDNVLRFGEIVSEIENGESKRTQTEISEELSAHKKTLSDAQSLSVALGDYFSGKSGIPTDSLFDDVFESSTISLNLDSKHSEILKEEDNAILSSVSNTTFLVIGLELLIVIIALSILFLRVINPINKLTEIAEDIGSGNIDVKIPTKLKKSKDEIGELANAFNILLQSSHASLSSLVESKFKNNRKVGKY
ncbi:HAMP domain-containing protein [Candidatus Pacearchaeota archaeon]|nr:HAMP domain-containing protein [Candidatus Pacearchaeota archaeon]